MVAVAIVLAAIGFGVGRGTAGGTSTTSATKFTGTVVSLYPDRTGGCVQADPGQGVEIGKDTHCGPFFVSKVSAQVGTRVTAVQYSFLLQPGAEAYDGLLLSPAP